MLIDYEKSNLRNINLPATYGNVSTLPLSIVNKQAALKFLNEAILKFKSVAKIYFLIL